LVVSSPRADADDEPRGGAVGRGDAIRLMALLLLATALRMYGLAAHGLWADEMTTVSTACGSVLHSPLASAPSFTPADFWAGNTLAHTLEAVVTQDGGNAVLYNVLLHAWVPLAGTSDIAVRLPSVLAGILTVAAAYALALRLATARVAWWAGVLVATQPLLIRLSQEARAYSLATLLGVVATLLFVRWIAHGGRLVLAAYGLTAAALLLTHYLAASVLAAHGAFAVLAASVRPRRTATVATLLGAALLASAWLPLGGARGMSFITTNNQQYRARADRAGADEHFARRAGLRTVTAGVVQISAGVFGNTLQNWQIRLARIGPLLLLPALLIAAAWRHRASIERVPGALALLAALSFASLAASVVLALISGHVISFQPRYAAFVAPYAAILLACGLASGGTVARAALAGHVAVQVASLWVIYADAPEYRPRNHYPVMAAAARQAPSGTAVYRSWPEARMVNLYLEPGPKPRQRVALAPADLR
jgi:uncharacterized membrane protein